MNKSESIKEVATALAKAQSAIRPAVFDKVNPHFKSKYASLASIQDACKQALSSNGLSVAQSFEHEGEHVFLETVLIHSSGEWLSSKIKLTVDKNNMQGFASASTYARRIGLASMVGVVADEDDDGNEASKTGEREQYTRPEIVQEIKKAAAEAKGAVCPDCGADGRQSKYKEGEFYCSEYKQGCKAKWSA